MNTKMKHVVQTLVQTVIPHVLHYSSVELTRAYVAQAAQGRQGAAS